MSRPTLTTLTIKGVDTHANGRKEKDKEEGETRRQEEDDEAPEEEISHSRAGGLMPAHTRLPLLRGTPLIKAEAAVQSLATSWWAAAEPNEASRTSKSRDGGADMRLRNAGVNDAR